MMSARIRRMVWPGVLCAVVVAILFFHFRFFFPQLKKNAFVSQNQADTPINIPQNLNFLNDDKQAFIHYCLLLYGEKLPLSVDDSTFQYLGAVDGYHFYRMQANLIDTEPARQSVRLGNFLFESDQLYRPSSIGLYLIKNAQVYTLENAYQLKLVNFNDLYRLYMQKDPTVNAGSSASSSKKRE